MTLRISQRLRIHPCDVDKRLCHRIAMACSKIRSEVSIAQDLSKLRLKPVWMMEEHLSRFYIHDISDMAQAVQVSADERLASTTQ